MAVVSFDLGPRPEVTVANPRELAKVLQRAAEVAIALSEATGTLDDVSDGSTKVAMTPAERTKLSGIESGATADQTGAEIKALYEAQADTNAYTDAEKIKLTGIEAGATADQTNAEILSGWESAAGLTVATDLFLEDGSIPLTGPLTLLSTDVSGAPSAGTAGRLIYVTDGDAGSPCLAVDNGTNWLRVALGAAISAT